MRYLLLPLIAVIAAITLSIVNKKNRLIPNKRLLFSLLLLGVVLALPGLLGLLRHQYMPWGYIMGQLYGLCCGCGLVFLLIRHHGDALLERKGFVAGALLIAGLAGTYLHQLLFNLFNDFDMGLWAATSSFTFMAPLFFWWSYVAFLSIPAEIYKVWQYPASPIILDMERLDFDRLLVLELELYKQSIDPEPIKVKVKAPENMRFGNWFYKFIEDYNIKFPGSPVDYLDDRREGLRWIFFTKSSFIRQNKFIDPDLDIRQNGITEKMTIYARRVSENTVKPEAAGEGSVFI